MKKKYQRSATRYKAGPLLKIAERRLIRGLIYTVAAVGRRVSLQASYRTADRIGRLLYRAYPRLRRTALCNLQIAFGDTLTHEERVSIAQRSFRNHCRSAIEVMRMKDLSAEDLIERVHLEGTEHLDRALAEGHGVILLTAHYGNWEFMGARLSLAGYAISAIARDQRDTGVTQLINESREWFGMKVVPRKDMRKALTCLRRNEILGILSDQHEVGGVQIKFFGVEASAATGAAVFALRTGARIVPAFVSRDEQNHHHVNIHLPIELIDTGDRTADVLANTQAVADVIEREIARRPDHWLWVHRRWRNGQGSTN